MTDQIQMNQADDIIGNIAFSNEMRKHFLSKRKIFMWGAVHDGSAREVTDQLLYLESKNPGQEITLYLSSPGGVVTSGMVVYDAMKMISSPVSTVCVGLAASMGSLILSGGEKGKRFIWPHGRVMIHQPSIGGLYGQASDIQIHATEIKKTKAMGAKVLSSNCNQSYEKVMEDLDRDYWMSAEESLAYGIVDGIAEQTGF